MARDSLTYLKKNHFPLDTKPLITKIKTMNKAILIDPKADLENAISVIDCGDFRDIQKHLKCDCFTTVQLDDRGTTLYVDDEGWIKYGSQLETVYHIGAFMWEGYGSPLAGRGLILGTNLATGESTDCEMPRLRVMEKVSVAKVPPHVAAMFELQPDISNAD